MNKLQNVLMKISDKMNKCKILNVMSGAFTLLFPILIIGSFFSILNGLPIEVYQNFITSIGIKDLLVIPYNVTYNYYSIYLVFAVAYQYMVKSGMKKNGVLAGFIAIAAYLMVVPETATHYFGTMGMFGAVIISYLSSSIIKLCFDKKITIRMPDSVPSGISNSFSTLVPLMIISIVMLIIRFGFGLTPLGDFQTAIYTLISVPIMSLGNNLFAEIIIIALSWLFWLFGIHGGMAVGVVVAMVYIPNWADNMAAFASGVNPPHMFTGPGTTILASISAICIAILIASKDKGSREVAKIALAPALFEIQEPIAFGLPIVLNPIFFIPYLINGIFPAVATRILQIVGFLNNPTCVNINQLVPVPVAGMAQFGWKGALLSVVFTVIAILVYIPFVKMNDKQLAKKALEKTGE